MISKGVKKLIVFVLCAIFVVPFINFTVNTAKASETIKAFKGAEIAIDLGDGLKNSSSSNLTIKVGDTEIYKSGSAVANSDYLVNVSTSNGKKYANITFFKNGTYAVNVKDSSLDKEKNATVEVGDTEAYITLKYKSFEGDAGKNLISEYKKLIEENTEEVFIAGDSSFTVPEISSLIETNFPYGSVRKTVYYYASGETSSKNTYASKADLKFSISTYGTYRFYVLANIEKHNLNIDGGITMKVDGLKEEKDGFYRYYDAENQEVYYNKGNNKFYKIDKDNDNGYSGDPLTIDETKKSLIVPVFEFTVQSQLPTIKIDSTYQENGYVGLKYKVTGVTINGDTTSEKYELLYSTEKSLDGKYDNFTLAEEEFDSSAFTFTPTKMGYYVVRVTAYSVDGVNKAYTPQIEVNEKYEQVKYKVSFSDWLDVNLLPFILFCISGACLVTIILLLTIKPKEKAQTKVEDDK